jgi:hypothetical protein
MGAYRKTSQQRGLRNRITHLCAQNPIIIIIIKRESHILGTHTTPVTPIEEKISARGESDVTTHCVCARFLATIPPCSRGMVSRNHANVEGSRWWLRTNDI